MKKGLSLVLALLLSVTLLSGCGASGASAAKDSGTSAAAGADTNAQEGTSDEIFTWEGTVITGLTEKGKTEETLTIPDKATAIGGKAFVGAAAAKVVWGANVEEIGKYAFYQCPNLSEITVPASVKKIDRNAFGLCNKLTSLTFSEGLTEIEDGAFTAISVATITLPEGLTTIGEYVFNPCAETTAIYLPASLENIPDNALFLDSEATVYVKEGSWADKHFEEFVGINSITNEASCKKAYY